MSRETQGAPATGGLVSVLAGHADVARLRGTAGQVLVYRGHRPPGAFLLLAGRVTLVDGRGPGAAGWDAGPEGLPLLLPSLDELDAPSGGTLIAGEKAEILFIPLTLAAGGSEVHRLLTEANLRSRPLR